MIVFDRGGYLYHGRIQALEAARQALNSKIFSKGGKRLACRSNTLELTERVVNINRVAKVVKADVALALVHW